MSNQFIFRRNEPEDWDSTNTLQWNTWGKTHIGGLPYLDIFLRVIQTHIPNKHQTSKEHKFTKINVPAWKSPRSKLLYRTKMCWWCNYDLKEHVGNSTIHAVQEMRLEWEMKIFSLKTVQQCSYYTLFIGVGGGKGEGGYHWIFFLQCFEISYMKEGRIWFFLS